MIYVTIVNDLVDLYNALVTAPVVVSLEFLKQIEALIKRAREEGVKSGLMVQDDIDDFDAKIATISDLKYWSVTGTVAA